MLDDPVRELKRDAVEAILDRYHQTRIAGDTIDFILADEHVDQALTELLTLYMTG